MKVQNKHFINIFQSYAQNICFSKIVSYNIIKFQLHLSPLFFEQNLVTVDWIPSKNTELNTIHSFKLNGQKLQIALDLWNTFVLKEQRPYTFVFGTLVLSYKMNR